MKHETICPHCGAPLGADDLASAVVAIQDHYSTCPKLPKTPYCPPPAGSGLSRRRRPARRPL